MPKSVTPKAVEHRTPLLSLAVLAVGSTLLAAEPTAPRLVVKPDAFPTLVNPMCSHCRDEAKRRAAELRDDDRVLCWIRGYSDGGAIPWRFFLNPYRVISDTYGVFVFDADAGFARGFEPSLDFTFHGWRNGVMVMKHKDGTLYSCLTGIAFDGPRKGERLEPVPTLVSDWGDWLKRYPQNVAYHMFDKYKPVELPCCPNEDALKSRLPADKRLAEDAVVLGVAAGKEARAYPLDVVGTDGLVRDKLDGQDLVILWNGPTRTAAAYRPVATPVKKDDGKPRTLTLTRTDRDAQAPFVDEETGSRWDVAGRAVEGKLKGWTLTWLDGTQVKWYAWAAEYPGTSIYRAGSASDRKVTDKVKEIAGTAEFLRAVPKHFARLEAVDVANRKVTLRVDGEKEAKAWPLAPDAEVKVAGWWGRLDQFQVGDRVWVWLKLNRQKQPVAVLMLTDERSEQDMHGRQPALESAPFETRRAEQQALLRKRWEQEGLPGTVTVTHLSGEMDLLLDHEAMRWGRWLKPGDEVSVLSTVGATRSVVKSVKPWRERTLLRLVVHGLDIGDLTMGKRVRLKMAPPPAEVREAVLPPDCDRPRTRDERIEWLLSSIYCTCGVGKDTCTGHVYTLASCNPNGCGLPNTTRQSLGKKIDQGSTDRQILEELRKERGPDLFHPHLKP